MQLTGLTLGDMTLGVLTCHTLGGQVCPTYFGVCSDVASIAAVAHDHGVPLIVDEAHGAHLAFHVDFPAPALPQGADISIQSTHKVLGR